MQQIIGFIIKNGLRLLFLMLLGISLWLTINHHSFHRSKFINSSNSTSGYVYSKTASIAEYFSLKSDNEKLFNENVHLKKLVLNEEESQITPYPNQSDLSEADFRIIGSKIIENSYRKQKNFLTLKGGSKQGIKRDMGVISDKGIVGIVEDISDNYCIVLSLLNTDFQTVAKIKKNNHFGTLTWNGKSTGFLQLMDIPRIASVTKGDTIVTGFSSKAFPENIPVGLIEKVYLDKETNSFTLDVRLFSDMTTLNHVYVVEHTHIDELKQLQNKAETNE